MPRNIATYWNSTYDMLIFALNYRQAIDEITADKDMRKYELSEDEWALVQQLGDVLAVRCASYHSLPSTHVFADIQGCNSVLFTFYTQPRHRDTRNGSHRCTSRHCRPKPEVLIGHSRIACTWESPSKQVLRFDRPFGSLPNSHE